MNGFVAGPHEPGLEHFTQWIDQEMRRSPDARAGILGAILGTSWGLSGAGVGIVAGGLQVANAWALTPLLLGIAGTLGGLSWYFRGRSADERELARVYGQTRRVLWRLHSLRWRSQLRSALGDQAVEILEEGARHWVRARASFDSPIWGGPSGGQAHLEARKRAKQAMDSAMSRLAMMAGVGGYQESEKGPAHRLVAEMAEMAREVQSLIERLGERSSFDSGEGSRDLREALGELRMLSLVEDELKELKERSSD